LIFNQFGCANYTYQKVPQKSNEERLQEWCDSSIIKVEKNNKGEFHGKFVLIGPCGKERIKGKYENAKRIGTWEIFQRTGVKELELNYYNDSLNGEVKIFYGTGSSNEGMIKVKGIYNNNLPDGKFFSFYDNEIRLIRLYEKGNLIEAKFKEENGEWNTGIKAKTYAERMYRADEKYLNKRENIFQMCIKRAKIQSF